MAAALSLMCSEPVASVLMGQLAVMAKPASKSPFVRASQAPVALWVNMSVKILSFFSTLWHSLKMAAILF